MKPLCFVLMPFGKRLDASGRQVDFDAVYRDLIAPAILEAGLEPLRADEEITGGLFNKAMLERLVLCDYAIVDLTTANAHVFYQLGLRHAVRQWSTILLFAEGEGQLPFDVAVLRALPYQLSSQGTPTELERTRRRIAQRLEDGKQAKVDSPIFQLLEDFPDVQRTKTDVFRERVQYSEVMKKRLAQARNEGLDALLQVERELGDVREAESGVVVDLFLSFRAVRGWPQMIALVEHMSPPLAATVMVQEQLALALNRNGQGEEAEKVIADLLARRGPSSETYGILGRIFKDRWEAAVTEGDRPEAGALLDKAIEAYTKGFESDWRDAYPGINAITLMELREPPDRRRRELIPVVTYAVRRRIAAGKADYWDHATLLELAVLEKAEDKAEEALHDALAAMREAWEAETTARNLRLIREARERRQEDVPWAETIELRLRQQAQK